MKYLVRLAHAHETFRQPELEALAVLARVPLHVLDYSHDSPFCLIDLPSNQAAKDFISRAILCSAIYEWWGTGHDYDSLHAAVAANEAKDLVCFKDACFKDASFKFTIDSFRGKRSMLLQRELIESFAYFDWQGPIVMRGADVEMVVFEDWEKSEPGGPKPAAPRAVHLGRLLGTGQRNTVLSYDLKKRKYISRTSMDAELSLVTALLTLAAPGKLLFDPFVGTGSFLVTAAFFGATVLGADIDARSIRGTTPELNLFSNFEQYGSQHCYLDSFVSDLNHTPMRRGRYLDGIICDPPYGIREGPKTLGHRPGKSPIAIDFDGKPAHLQHGWVPPKRPYGFDDMMMDVLEFAFDMLVDNGRLSVWMPTANDQDIELPVPSHPGLAIISICTQDFNKWSRRLLTYRRLPDAQVDPTIVNALSRSDRAIGVANDINRFRKKYFEGFKP